MIDYRFGPIDPSYEPVIDLMLDLGDPILAQNFYNVRTSNLYATTILSQGYSYGFPDVDFDDTFIATQHALWNGHTIEGRGMWIDPSYEYVLENMRHILAANALTVEPIDEATIEANYGATMRELGVQTLGALETSIGLSGKPYVNLQYPKFIATDGDIVRARQSVNDIDPEALDRAVYVARSAISRAWHNTNNRT